MYDKMRSGQKNESQHIWQRKVVDIDISWNRETWQNTQDGL